MGHGILAFVDRDRAEATAAELGGEVIDWETVMALPVVEGLLGDQHDGGGMDMDMSDGG